MNAFLIVVPILIYHYVTYGAVLPQYYQGHLFADKSYPLNTLIFVGQMFSPSRGLFIFSPVLLFSLVGMLVSIRNNPKKLWYYVPACIILLHTLMLARFPHWWGGSCYGPRLFTDIIPFLMFYFILYLFYFDQIKFKSFLKPLLYVTIIVSFFFHFRGATNWDTQHWNSNPKGIDGNPERLWDWTDPQFLRGLQK